ncbi:MAG: UDP-N-acetylmuramoyl-L-alanine--D-glutamate ligase [Candidatus Paceibacterota bacterium]
MKKSDYIDNFKDKKITMMGLGLLGRGVNVAKFLAECGAELIITDLKNTDELAESLEKLKKYKNIKYVLGRHRLGEFEGRDMIIKAASVPKDSKYLERAREENTPVEMDASLFARLAPADTKIIGVTGTRGKSTVTHLVHDILDEAGERVHLGGNVKGRATLPLLKTVKSGDYVVLELDSWQLQGFGESSISPDFAVFTNLLEDHQDYYKNMREYFKDKANIFLYQQPEDYLITTENSFAAIQKYYGERAATKIKGTMAMAKPKILLNDYKMQLVGEHNRQNVAAAVQLADLLRIDSSVTKRAVANFKPLDGRLQYVRKILGRSIYNDNNATTPDATVAAIKSLHSELEKNAKITLIMGGSDKGLDTTELERVIKRHVSNVVLIPGTGTDEVRFKLYDDDELNIDEKESIHDALQLALEEMSSPGDTIIFSPAFASFDQFSNEYEREEAFLKAVDKLKR